MDHATHPTFWTYLGSFILYTLLTIGMIYGLFLVLKKNPNLMAFLTQRPLPNPNHPLSIETSLPLEPRKTLYIVRSGSERFLIATSPESTQFLSRLEGSNPATQTVESNSMSCTHQFDPAGPSSTASQTNHPLQSALAKLYPTMSP